MQPNLSTSIALTTILASACGGTSKPDATQPPVAAARTGLQIKLVTIYVDDQEKALRFYTDVLGFAKKDDFTNGPYRWLSVTDGDNELQLAKNDNPAAKAFQAAQFEQEQPAIMFYTGDVKADYERIKARGADFTMPPTEVMAGSQIAILKDGCGNFVQLTQLDR
jgi:predicted enzyme related to lactoylglutathione lyase